MCILFYGLYIFLILKFYIGFFLKGMEIWVIRFLLFFNFRFLVFLKVERFVNEDGVSVVFNFVLYVYFIIRKFFWRERG